MKVTLEKNYKDFYTISDLERAKMVIKYEKENDDMTPAGWAEYAVNEALKDTHDFMREILKATARTARNRRAWNAYGDETENMDVWIEAVARTAYGFIEVHAYLTDIWQTGATPYRQHIYLEYYTESELK